MSKVVNSDLWQLGIAPLLEKLGLLTELDQMALAAYCQSYSDWRAAVEFLEENGNTFETGNGYRVSRPEVAIARRAQKNMADWGVEFGMTPNSRGRMVVPGTNEADKEWE